MHWLMPIKPVLTTVTVQSAHAWHCTHVSTYNAPCALLHIQTALSLTALKQLDYEQLTFY